ncbi:hypothetical protein MUU46_15830 [Scandinavium sp. TWS1a]|uniref:hypothetical protein n=1 Tax=Scandinavium tedordense TaxID=2926521 RepID=UPI002165C32B|nr:hypothetical protein [Scandinavium tedordense]MCS2171775.1 hypothetical protein [Scandinavium tedordense]
MSTTLSPDSDLLTFPFTASTDFTDLADCGDRFAETLIEYEDDVHKKALFARQHNADLPRNSARSHAQVQFIRYTFIMLNNLDKTDD